MCEHLKGVTDLTAAAQALTLACMRHAGPPVNPLNKAYGHVVCEPVPAGFLSLLELLDQDRASN